MCSEGGTIGPRRWVEDLRRGALVHGDVGSCVRHLVECPEVVVPFHHSESVGYQPCLAIQSQHPHTKIFVRSFFSDYYDYITAAFAGTKSHGVSVFGAPGVGSSVFLAYFFLRYQLQHPTATFVFVSYVRGHHVRQALVLKNDAVVKKLLPFQAKRLEDEFEDDPDAIFLLDGTPKRTIFSNHRHLVCSNPSKALTTANSENHYPHCHGEIYVPLWEVDELKAAIEALGLDDKLGKKENIADFPRSAEARYEDEVEYRFDVFGGVACPCLETDTEFVDSLRTALERDAERDAVCVDLMTGNRERLPRDYCEEVSDLLFHCYPSSGLRRPGYAMSSKLKTASPYVTQLLAARVDAMHPVERAYFEWKGRRIEPVAAFQQSRIAQRMLEALESGVELVANSLAHGHLDVQFDLKLSIQPSVPTTIRPPMGSFTFDLAGGPCFVLQGNGLESIQALYLIKSQKMQACTPWEGVEAVVFLAPSTHNYCVPAKSLLWLLQRLDLANGSPQRVALVFGVREDRADSFKTQEFECAHCVDNYTALAAVDGLTTEMATVLKTANIHTVRDVRQLPTGLTLSEEQAVICKQARALLREEDNKAVVTGSANHEMLKQIPQFVWGVKE